MSYLMLHKFQESDMLKVKRWKCQIIWKSLWAGTPKCQHSGKVYGV